MKYPQFFFESPETLQYIRHCSSCTWESSQCYAADGEGEDDCPECGSDDLESLAEYL